MTSTGKDKRTILRKGQEAANLIYKDAFEQAEAPLRAALELTLDQNDAATFMWQQRLAESLLGQGKFADAASLAKKAGAGFRRYGDDDENRLDCVYLEAECLFNQRQLQQAGDLAKTALQGLENNTRRGPEHPITLKCRAILALVIKGDHKLTEAENLAKENMEYFEAVLLRSETYESMGSRKMPHSDKQAMKKVHTFSVMVLGESCKPKRMPTIESCTSAGGDSEDGGSSRWSSKQSVPANPSQLEPVGE